MRFAALLTLLTLAPAGFAQQPVAPTDAKSPEDERKSFKLPPGFVAQLVAAEPQAGVWPFGGTPGIQKPIQIAFDAKGRLWVTTSYHYPFAAPRDEANDKLFILSDFGDDGRAKKVEVFDEKLNIPIGILPLPDCKSCIVSTCGEILKLTDADGDGKADTREVLFSGFGFKDTHGMYNSFTYLPDGWVYGCHGFSNESRVKGKDGHEVHMQSGNTFRFRPDGSRIEVYTRGQVNPFGMTVDPWFNLYTADCHSKPITQLIKGAYYDSFGKPHDGLGYAPHVTKHDHGSTGLCGLSWYDADQFPEQWKGCMFLGNVVTSRINADVIEWKGSTPVAKELPDFLVSGDPWFRPSDLKLGPDGALYVSDFYNKIIGHYEVDLKHPGRDKSRGRVWRIVWQGTDGKVPPPKMPFADLTKEKMERLVELSGSANLTVRLAATLHIQRRGEEFRAWTAGAVKPKLSSNQKNHLFWAADKLSPVPVSAVNLVEGMFGRELLTDMTHALRYAGTRADSKAEARKLVLRSLHSTFPQTVRAAIEGMTSDPHPEFILPLANFIPTIAADDAGLRHAARIAQRNALTADASQEHLVWVLHGQIGSGLPPAKVLDDVFLGVPTAYAGWWFSERLKIDTLDPALLDRATEHVGRYGCDCHRGLVVDAVLRRPSESKRVAALKGLAKGLQAAGVTRQAAGLSETTVKNGLNSRSTDVIQQYLELAVLANVDVTAEAAALARSRVHPAAVRAAALTAVMKAPREVSMPVCGEVFRDTAAPLTLREQALGGLTGSQKTLDLIALKDALKDSPYRLATAIAVSLSSSKSGVDQLFAAIKLGHASARLLQEKAVLDRLKATNADKWEARVKELTAGLPSADARLAALLKERGDGFKKAKIDLAAGQKVFGTTCANCHQLGGQGAKVGPQLDGIGNRGVERILEDVLDPNRNVDHAFYTTTLELKDGRQLSGLLRVEGKTLILIDPQAKETRVGEADVDKKRTSPLSPMPSDIAEKLKPQDFYHLVGYLAEQRQK